MLLPLGLGPTILHTDPVVSDIATAGGDGRIYNLGAPIAVAPGIQSSYQDEVTAGAEFAFARAVRFTTWGQARWLRRGYDTTPTAFDNPGRDGLPEATRQTQQITAQLETAPTSKLALRVGMLYGRATGEWTGAYDPRQGAILYAGSDYDTDATNQLGRLPQDPGARMFVEAARRGSLGSVDLSLTLRLTAGTGRPRNVLADNGEGVIELLPRGSYGNAPLDTNTNVRLAARWHKLDVTLDIFNLFDLHAPTTIDEIYTDARRSPDLRRHARGPDVPRQLARPTGAAVDELPAAADVREPVLDHAGRPPRVLGARARPLMYVRVALAVTPAGSNCTKLRCLRLA